MIIGILSFIGDGVWYYANLQTAATQICTYLRILMLRILMLILRRTLHENTTFCNRLLMSDMLVVVRHPLHNMLPFVRGFELKIQPAFYTGKSVLNVLLLPPVIKIIKKHTGKHKTLACNGMSLDGFMRVNNSWGYSTGRTRGIKTTGLRVY
jgi:hypothetical protein